MTIPKHHVKNQHAVKMAQKKWERQKRQGEERVTPVPLRDTEYFGNRKERRNHRLPK